MLESTVRKTEVADAEELRAARNAHGGRLAKRQCMDGFLDTWRQHLTGCGIHGRCVAVEVTLVVFPVLAYYTGKYHLNDTMTLTSLTFFTLGRVQASLTLLSLTQKVPMGDGLYADLCLVSNLGHQ